MAHENDGRRDGPATTTPAGDTEPAITAVITCHDDRDCVVAAVTSALSQSGPTAVEVVVIDDGSRDGSADLLQEVFAGEPRLRIISQSNTGLSRARNRGMTEARTRWVAFLDADDVWLPGRLAAAAEVITTRPDVSLVYGDLQRVGGHRPGPVRATDYAAVGPSTREAILEAEGPVTPSTYTVRIDDALAVGGFDPAMPGVEDVDFALRIAAIGAVVHIAEPLVVKSDRPGSMSKDRLRRLESTRRMVQNAVAQDPLLQRAGQVRISRAESKLARHLARDGDVRGAVLHAAGAVRRTPRLGFAWSTLAVTAAVAPAAALVRVLRQLPGSATDDQRSRRS